MSPNCTLARWPFRCLTDINPGIEAHSLHWSLWFHVPSFDLLQFLPVLRSLQKSVHQVCPKSVSHNPSAGLFITPQQARIIAQFIAQCTKFSFWIYSFHHTLSIVDLALPRSMTSFTIFSPPSADACVTWHLPAGLKCSLIWFSSWFTNSAIPASQTHHNLDPLQFIT